MTFQQLQYLLEVHKTASFSQAAKNLFVTQSSVSNAIIALEQELGFPIFLRSRGGLHPTPEGIEVITHADNICESHRLMTDKSHPRKSAVRISTINYPPVYEAFYRFVQEHQHRNDISLSLERGSGPSEAILERLSLYELELVVQDVFSTFTNSVIKDLQKHHLHCEILDTIPAAICIGPGHRLYHKPIIEPVEFENEVMLDGPEKVVSTAKPLTAFLHINPERVMVVTETEFRKRLVRMGYAYEIGPIPQSGDPKTAEFRYIPLPGLSYNVLAITNRLNSPTPEFQRYLELMREESTAYRSRIFAPSI